MRSVGSPLPGDARTVGKQEQMTLAPGQFAHSVKEHSPFTSRQMIVAKDYARPFRQSHDHRRQIVDPRIGHQPESGERVAVVHIAAYSGPMTEAETRLADVCAAIAKAAKTAGRAAEATTLIAVSKTRIAEEIALLIAEGQRDFGENRVQEAQLKWPALVKATPEIRLHLVGQLQSNKAEEAVALFDVIHSVDRLSLISALAKAQDKMVRKPACFLQVNIGEEDQKGGCATGDIPVLLAEAQKAGVHIVGLMAVPPADHEPAPYFALLAKLARYHGLDQLSMGMSGDFETAVKLGATYIRVGTALFGARG